MAWGEQERSGVSCPVTREDVQDGWVFGREDPSSQ